MSCKLCDALQGTSDEAVLLDDPAGTVLLSSDRAVLGHLVVVSRSHVENASELAPADGAAFFALVTRAERAALEASRAERAILMKLGIAVPHLHVHIYPVSREASRADVMAAIDMQVKVSLGPVEQEAFEAELRRLLLRQVAG